MISLSKKVTSHSLQSKFFNLLQVSPDNFHHNHKENGRMRSEHRWCILSKRVHQSQLTMDSFSKELVKYASTLLFLDKTMRFFTNFLPEQLNLDNQWAVEISETSNPTVCQNVKEELLEFLDKKNVQSC